MSVTLLQSVKSLTMKFSQKSHRIVAKFIRFLQSDLMTSEQSHIALLRFLDELKRNSWRVTQLSNSISEAELLAKLALQQATVFCYRSLSSVILRSPTPDGIKLLLPLTGRAPPIESFVPIPKTELGSCARSDLPDSAY